MILPILTALHLGLWEDRVIEDGRFLLHGGYTRDKESSQEKDMPLKVTSLVSSCLQFGPPINMIKSPIKTVITWNKDFSKQALATFVYKTAPKEILIFYVNVHIFVTKQLYNTKLIGKVLSPM